jgi:ATP-dependent Clp protease protease subunit
MTGEKTFDLYARMLKNRNIVLGTDLDDDIATVLIAQLLFLESEDPDKEITLYINSRGGSVTAAFALYETITTVRPPVRTICVENASGTAALILAAGARGRRVALQSTSVILFPLVGAPGPSAPGAAEEIERMSKRFFELLASCTGQPEAQLISDSQDRRGFGPAAAQRYGFIDTIAVNPRL